MPDPIEHPYSPNVTNCSEHDMGDCPYHKGGPCQWRDDPDTPERCGRNEAQHAPQKPTACHNRACSVVRPHQHHEGYLSSGEVTPMPWTPKARPPVGQYTVEIVLTGDDIGLDALAWFIQHQLATHGFTVYVQAITPTRKA